MKSSWLHVLGRFPIYSKGFGGASAVTWSSGTLPRYRFLFRLVHGSYIWLAFWGIRLAQNLLSLGSNVMRVYFARAIPLSQDSREILFTTQEWMILF